MARAVCRALPRACCVSAASGPRRALTSGARAAESGAGGAPSAASVAGAYTTTFKAAVGSGILTVRALRRRLRFSVSGSAVCLPEWQSLRALSEGLTEGGTISDG